MRESAIEAKVCKYAKEKGWFTAKWRSVNNRGVPDRIFINPYGVTVYVEFKTEKGVLSPLQSVKIEALKQRGCIVIVVNSVDNGKVVVDHFQDWGNMDA